MTPHRAREAEIGEILARVEAATGPDRELDADLCIALAYIEYAPEPLNLRRSTSDDGWLDYETVEDGKTVECSDTPPGLTASIDAALALVERVLPSMGATMWIWPDAATAAIGTKEIDFAEYMATVKGKARTAPLAILTALLRALSTGAHQ